jgi:hypothetical protein
MSNRPRLKSELVRGTPIQVMEAELIPLIRVRSLVRREVMFGTQTSNGTGVGLVWLKPVAVIQRLPDGVENRIPIYDAAGLAVQGMLIGALALSVLCLVATVLAQFWRAGSTDS